MMRRREPTLAVLVLMLVAMPVAAQETLTLDEAIARSLAHSARLAELDARRAGADAVEAGRAAAKLPIISAQAGYTRTNHVDAFLLAAPGRLPQVLYPDVPDNYRARIDLQWPIYTAGRADALERAARAEGNAVGEEREAARADLRFEVTQAFWALVTARETEHVLQRSLERFDLHVRDLQARLEQGFISPHELLSAQAHRSRQRLMAIEAATLRQTADANLRRLIGGGALPIVPAVSANRPAADPPASEPSGSVARTAGRSISASRRRRNARLRRPPPASPSSPSAVATTSPARTRGSSRGSSSGNHPGMRRSISRGRCGTAAAAAPSAPRRRRRHAR
jgi:outer membrane protein TolC